MPLLLTQLLIILAAAWLAGWLFRKMGQPGVIGEMAAGIALGPSCLGAAAPDAFAAVFPPDRLLPLATLSQIAVILLVFAVGLRLDHACLRRHAQAAWFISHSSIICPFVLGCGLALLLHAEFAPSGVQRLPFALFVGAAMSVTAFPVLARILAERRLTETPLGTLTIACAAVDDVTAWCLLAVVLGVVSAGLDLLSILTTVAGTVIFAGFMLLVVQRVLTRWARARFQTPADASHAVNLAAIVAVASALVTEAIGVHALFGAFLAGLAIPRANRVAATVADKLDDGIGALLLPVFFAFSGLRTNLQFLGAPALGVFAAVLAVAVLGKLGGSAIAGRLSGVRWPAALAIGVLMNTRGLMELVILNIGLDANVISPALFAVMVLMTFATTVVASPLLTLIARALGTDGMSRLTDARMYVRQPQAAGTIEDQLATN